MSQGRSFHRMARGAVHRGVKEKRFKSGEQWEVIRREEGAVSRELVPTDLTAGVCPPAPLSVATLPFLPGSFGSRHIR